MAKLLQWLKSTAVNVLDSDRRERIDEAAQSLHQIITDRQKAFKLEASLPLLQIYKEDTSEVVPLTYEMMGQTRRNCISLQYL